MQNKYQWILFDADDTLFNFDSFGGLKATMAKYNIDFTHDDYATYQVLNKALWIELQQSKITSKDLKTIRFELLAKQVGVTPEQLNNEFSQAMVSICTLIDGVAEVLSYCRAKGINLAIITNGFSDLQDERLKHHNLQDYFQALIISEDVGVAKPNLGIFDYAFKQMAYPSKDRVLIVGDTLDSDILGGINAGIDSCWFNHVGAINTRDFRPNYEISQILQLKNFL